MTCDECSEQMQKETLVRVTRERGRHRSVVRPGWHCWTCRTTTYCGPERVEAARAGSAQVIAATALRMARISLWPTRTPA